MKIRVFDVETTGMPPDARLCEVGWCDLIGEVVDPTSGLTQWDVGYPIGKLLNPGIPMPPEARAIHHIGDLELVDAPSPDVGLLALGKGDPDIFVAHNAAFEQNFYTGGEKPWICTLKIARRLWPECPSHTNQCLRYWLGIELDYALAMPPHRAAPDAYVTAHILQRALDEASIDQMIAWTSEPSLLPRVTFGKYRNKSWSDLPLDYLSWIVNKSDMDADTKFTARHHLKAASQR